MELKTHLRTQENDLVDRKEQKEEENKGKEGKAKKRKIRYYQRI